MEVRFSTVFISGERLIALTTVLVPYSQSERRGKYLVACGKFHRLGATDLMLVHLYKCHR